MSSKKKKSNSWYNHPCCDLRSDHDPKECHYIFAHPFVTITIFIFGFLLLSVGLYNLVRYMTVKEPGSINRLYMQTTIVFFAITIMGFLIPGRYRFGYTLYGILTLFLILQYAIFFLCFQPPQASQKHLEAIEYVADWLHKHPDLEKWIEIKKMEEERLL